MSHGHQAWIKWKCNYTHCRKSIGETTDKSVIQGQALRHSSCQGGKCRKNHKLYNIYLPQKLLYSLEILECNTAAVKLMPGEIKKYVTSDMITDYDNEQQNDVNVYDDDENDINIFTHNSLTPNISPENEPIMSMDENEDDNYYSDKENNNPSKHMRTYARNSNKKRSRKRTLHFIENKDEYAEDEDDDDDDDEEKLIEESDIVCNDENTEGNDEAEIK
eukprot:326729_1